MTILYVEDDLPTRQAIAGRLRRRGYDVVEATSGEEALGHLAEQPRPEAVLLDVDLPGINGIETYRRMLVIHPNLPAVVCSAKVNDGAREPFLKLGVPADALLAKPCEFKDLLAALQSVLPAEQG